MNETSPGGCHPENESAEPLHTLRGHIHRYRRRALPPGGKVSKNYELVGENGPTKFSELFGDKQRLAIYGKRLP